MHIYIILDTHHISFYKKIHFTTMSLLDDLSLVANCIIVQSSQVCTIFIHVCQPQNTYTPLHPHHMHLFSIIHLHTYIYDMMLRRWVCVCVCINPLHTFIVQGTWYVSLKVITLMRKTVDGAQSLYIYERRRRRVAFKLWKNQECALAELCSVKHFWNGEYAGWGMLMRCCTIYVIQGIKMKTMRTTWRCWFGWQM